MKNRWFAKIAAILCAICLAIGVMSQTMFARDSATALAAEEDALPEATFVVLGDETDPTAAPAATTDNRLSVPVSVDGAPGASARSWTGSPIWRCGTCSPPSVRISSSSITAVLSPWPWMAF